jgi:hypothetical protein
MNGEKPAPSGATTSLEQATKQIARAADDRLRSDVADEGAAFKQPRLVGLAE